MAVGWEKQDHGVHQQLNRDSVDTSRKWVRKSDVRRRKSRSKEGQQVRKKEEWVAQIRGSGGPGLEAAGPGGLVQRSFSPSPGELGPVPVSFQSPPPSPSPTSPPPSPSRLSPATCAQIRVLVSSCVTDDCSSYGLFALGELEAGRNELRDLIWRDLIGRGLNLDQNLIEKSLQERD